jgi:hypothetical protein
MNASLWCAWWLCSGRLSVAWVLGCSAAGGGRGGMAHWWRLGRGLGLCAPTSAGTGLPPGSNNSSDRRSTRSSTRRSGTRRRRARRSSHRERRLGRQVRARQGPPLRGRLQPRIATEKGVVVAVLISSHQGHCPLSQQFQGGVPTLRQLSRIIDHRRQRSEQPHLLLELSREQEPCIRGHSPAVERRTDLYLGEKVKANLRRMTMMHGSRRLPVQESVAKPLIRGELPTPMQQPPNTPMNKAG